MTFVLYSMAGEKMPWLLVNIALPMILISGKFLGDIVSTLRWKQVRENGGLWLIPLSWLFLYLLYRILVITSYGQSFGDLLQIFMTAFVFCLVTGLSLRVLNRAPAGSPFGLIVLSLSFLFVLLGARSAIIGSFDNAEEPTEMIVYAQTSQRVPVIMEKIQVASDYSKANNKEFHVIVDKDVYWGLSWYLRGFENIQYEDFSYIEVALDGSPIQSPESSVLILSEYNEGNLFARLGNYDEGERFNYLWWPPEEYKPCKTNQNDGCITPGKIVKNVTTFEKWKELFEYMMYRKTEAKFLHHDAIFYTGIGDKE